MARVLVTGAAGFIGAATTERLLDRGDQVTGVDSFSPYYDPALKRARAARIGAREGFRLVEGNLADRAFCSALFAEVRPELVVHLAAQPGVRYSLENPAAYVDDNLVAFGNVLEGCRAATASHLVYASSSSVYGGNAELPFSVEHNVDRPLSLYAATKKANELMAHSYAHLFGFPTTGLRFFTVYGPWGRPDMAPWLFTSAILQGRPIDLFNHGEMKRDFTYVDDVVEGVLRVLDRPPVGERPYRIYNLGNDAPVELLRFVAILEELIGKKAVLRPKPMEPGDVLSTWADIGSLRRDTGFAPATPIEEGLSKLVAWFRSYHRL